MYKTCIAAGDGKGPYTCVHIRHIALCIHDICMYIRSRYTHVSIYIYVYGARGRDRESEERDREGGREGERERERAREREREKESEGGREGESERVGAEESERETNHPVVRLGVYKMLNENTFCEHVQAGQVRILKWHKHTKLPQMPTCL